MKGKETDVVSAHLEGLREKFKPHAYTAFAATMRYIYMYIYVPVIQYIVCTSALVIKLPYRVKKVCPGCASPSISMLQRERTENIFARHISVFESITNIVTPRPARKYGLRYTDCAYIELPFTSGRSSLLRSHVQNLLFLHDARCRDVVVNYTGITYLFILKINCFVYSKEI